MKEAEQQQRCWIVEACSTKSDLKYCRTQNRILSRRPAEQRQKFLAKLHVASRDDIPPRFSPPWGCRISHCSRFFPLEMGNIKKRKSRLMFFSMDCWAFSLQCSSPLLCICISCNRPLNNAWLHSKKTTHGFVLSFKTLKCYEWKRDGKWK